MTISRGYSPGLVEAALEHLAAGRSVLPIVNKKPMVKWKGFQSRLATESEARAWFKNAGPKTQLALILGRISGGLWVLDADGPAAVQWLEKNALPTTVSVITRRGRHNYYRMPDGAEIRSTANLIPALKDLTGDQVDIKGEAGYAVIPPSPHSEGFYQWIITGEGWAGVPEWAGPGRDAALTRKESPAQVSDKTTLSGQPLPHKPFECRPGVQGERNSLLARYAGERLARGWSAEEVRDWALGWNAGNQPPLESKEVLRTVGSIAKIHIRNHGPQPIAAPPLPPAAPKAPEDSKHCPGQITRPGGLLEQIMDYIRDSSVASFPLFSLGAALTLVGTLVGQKIMTETRLRTNLIVFALAPSGTGKNAPLMAVNRLLEHCRLSAEYLGPNSLASAGALLTALAGRQGQALDGSLKPKGLLLLLDEIGDFLGAAKNRGNTAKNELFAVLKELYSKTESGFSKTFADAGKNIYLGGPHLSIYATGTADQFWGNFTTNEITDGFLARGLIFDFDLEIQKKRRVIADAPAECLQRSLTTLAALPTVAASGNLSQMPAPRLVPKSREAEALFEQWEDEFLAVQNQRRHDNTAGIYNRAAEHIHKIALIHAVSLAGDIPAEVEVNSVEYAIAFVNWAVVHMTAAMTEKVSHGEADDLRKRILRQVRKSGAAGNREIYRSLNRCSAAQAKDALEALEKAGEITLTRDGLWIVPKTIENSTDHWKKFIYYNVLFQQEKPSPLPKSHILLLNYYFCR